MWRVPLFYRVSQDKELILLCYETDRAGLLPAPQGVRSVEGRLFKENHVINELPSHYVILNIRLVLTVKILVKSLPLF